MKGESFRSSANSFMLLFKGEAGNSPQEAIIDDFYHSLGAELGFFFSAASVNALRTNSS